jgi:hypothetical protein
MYNPPANSTYTQSLQDDIFDLIENDLAKYSEKGNILIMGDLNARTSDDNDFIQNDSNDNTVPQYDDYTPDVEIINLFSRDTVLLSSGRALHDMSIQTGLRILNGRCIGDLTGNFTCHNFHGSSVVDYACVSECLLPKVKSFSVHNFLPDLSDHCQISLMMKINCTLKPDDNQMYPLPILINELKILLSYYKRHFQNLIHKLKLNQLITQIMKMLTVWWKILILFFAMLIMLP